MIKQLSYALILVSLPIPAYPQQAAWLEFMSGQRATYSSKGSAKAKGLEISFDYPVSWSGADGRRPNTLYQVTSNFGKGLELCNLVIRELPLPAGYTPTRSEVLELFEARALPGLIPAGSTYIGGAPTQLDGQLGAWINFSHDMDRAGIALRMQWLAFHFYYEKRLVNFSCAVGASGKTPTQDVRDRYRTFLPLFQQMANSLIIHSKWKVQPAPGA